MDVILQGVKRMPSVAIPENTLKDLLLNVQLLVAGMSNETVEHQVEILWSHMPGTIFDRDEGPPSAKTAEVINIFTRRTL